MSSSGHGQPSLMHSTPPDVSDLTANFYCFNEKRGMWSLEAWKQCEKETFEETHEDVFDRISTLTSVAGSENKMATSRQSKSREIELGLKKKRNSSR